MGELWQYPGQKNVKKMMTPALYLIPVGLSDAEPSEVVPARNLEIMKDIRHFVVENVRTARRWLRRCDRTFSFEGVEFTELNEHTPIEEVSGMLAPLRRGEPIGVMSEAGCPAVADPGSDLVAIAQREGLRVIPLVGPSSILLSLMASGFNGQSFCFHGYLPVDDKEKARVLRDLEKESRRLNRTQIFIETPYRNEKLLRFMADTLMADTLVCVACNVTDPERENIRTLTASGWKNARFEFNKQPAIFLIYRDETGLHKSRGRKQK